VKYAQKRGYEYTPDELEDHGTLYCRCCERYTNRCTCDPKTCAGDVRCAAWCEPDGVVNSGGKPS